MQQEKMERINALTKLSRQRELTQEEQEERQALRAEYVASMRTSLRATLENTYVTDENGTAVKLQKRSKDA